VGEKLPMLVSVAACLVLAGAAFATQETPAGYARHRHAPVVHDVVIEDSRVVAHAFARRYPDLIVDGEGAAHARFEESLPEAEALAARAVGRALVDAWIERHPLGAEPVTEAMRIVRRTVRNQRQVPMEERHLQASQHHPRFELGTIARLMRGVTNCEGENHLLALLLAERMPVTLSDHPGHTLVTARSGGVIFADAWSELPPFRAEEHASLPRFGERFGEHAEELPFYTEGRALLRPPARSSIRLPPLPAGVHGELSRFPPRTPETRLPHGFGAYLRARVEDLFGDPEEARARYAIFLGGYCDGAEERWTCEAARSFGQQ